MAQVSFGLGQGGRDCAGLLVALSVLILDLPSVQAKLITLMNTEGQDDD